MKMHEVIAKDLNMFGMLVKAGVVSVSFLNYYEIYRTFIGAKSVKSKMDRYYYTAEATRNTTATVRRAVAIMERRV